MKILKCKIIGGKKYQVVAEVSRTEKGPDTIDVKYHAEPAQAFFDAMNGLKKYVLELCEISGVATQNIQMIGVHFKYSGENETMGAQMFARKKLSGEKENLLLVTPYRLSAPYKGDKEDPDKLLPKGCITALEKLQAQAESYFKGLKGQTGLFDE